MQQIKPKGTRDFLPKDTFKLNMLEGILKEVCETNGYREIRTPMFEHTDVFARSSGETSDIVNKEMYTFLDRGNRSVSLRPEGTAGVIRAVVENKAYVDADLPLRLFYLGPNFRYERPQAGRYRQFSQLGVETIGIKNPYLDAEVILFAVDLLTAIGITDVTIKLNSIGDSSSRQAYKEALKEYFKPYLDDLCEDCKVRFEKNPLRILDCKVDANKDCMKSYPRIKDYLSKESTEYFAKVCSILSDYKINYELDDKLVRGLDYYNDIVFEVYAKTSDGRDLGAILAGGRYDNLVKEFDGPELPSFGFAMGIDRVLEICEQMHVFDKYKDRIMAYVMPMDEKVFDYAFIVYNYLKLNGVSADIDYLHRSLKSQFKTVDRKNAMLSILIGEDEMAHQEVTIKVNETKKQFSLPLENLLSAIGEILNGGHSHGCGCGCEDHHEEDECECGCGGHHHHHHDDEECGCGCGGHGHHHGDCDCGDDCCCGDDCDCDDDCCCGEHHDEEEHECCCGNKNGHKHN